MNSLSKLVAAGTFALVLAGCASGVKRDDSSVSRSVTPVGNVTVSLSPAAQKLAAENPKFNHEQLLSTVRRTLEAGGLLRKGTPDTAEIVLTEFRVRGTFSAIMWGAMAGADNVTGDVIVRNQRGEQVRKFQVHAVYALGGFAGGMDDTRLGWLYEKFAEHTAAELGGSKPNP
jgi:hypothetical protein